MSESLKSFVSLISSKAKITIDMSSKMCQDFLSSGSKVLYLQLLPFNYNGAQAFHSPSCHFDLTLKLSSRLSQSSAAHSKGERNY